MLVVNNKPDLVSVYVPLVEEKRVAGVLLVGVRFDSESMGLWYCSCISLSAAEY